MKTDGDSILFVSDVHCRFTMVNRQISHAEQTFGIRVSAVVVLGDFGVFPWRLREFFERKNLRFASPLYFIEGNHEDFANLERMKEVHSDKMTHLGRGEITEIAGSRFLSLGGCAYMDAMNTPPGAEITASDIARCLAHDTGSADIVISHDCPAGLGVPGSQGFEFYGNPGFTGGLGIAEKIKPALWLFGHHHRWYDKALNGVRYLGIPEIWKGYALLKPGFEVVTVENGLEDDPIDIWERIRRFFNS